MAAGTEKGKIPRSEWANILARYRGGAAIAHIARDYGCTAPAIRYIIKRNGELRDSGEKEAPEQAASRQRLPAVPRALPAASGNRVLGVDLRKRVSADIASFLVALDQAVVEGSDASAAELQEATDRLMRSVARIRLELERVLEVEQTAPLRSRGLKSSASGPPRGG